MTLHRNAKRTPSSRLALVRRVLFEGYCQVDEKLVDRPPRYWVLARREPTMLGIKTGRQPQLDPNTLTDAKRTVDVMRAMPASRKRKRNSHKCAPYRWLLPDHGADALTCEECGRYLKAGDQVNGAMPSGLVA